MTSTHLERQRLLGAVKIACTCHRCQPNRAQGCLKAAKWHANNTVMVLCGEDDVLCQTCRLHPHVFVATFWSKQRASNAHTRSIAIHTTASDSAIQLLADGHRLMAAAAHSCSKLLRQSTTTRALQSLPTVTSPSTLFTSPSVAIRCPAARYAAAALSPRHTALVQAAITPPHRHVCGNRGP